MKAFAVAARRLHWINVPAALLVALLQRTPALRVAAAAEEVAASQVGAVLRSAVAAVASLGAMHTLTGATQFVLSASSVSGTVGTAVTAVGFAVTGATAPVGSYRITNLPPGLTVPGSSGGVLNATSGTITGTPTAAGTFSTSILAYQFSGAQGPPSETFGPATVTFTIAAPVVAPAITTQPVSQTVTTGATATFTVVASGSPAPTYQWRKSGSNLPGATNATLTIANAQSANAGSYDVVATNSQGAAISATVTLTVNPPNVPPSITTQPVSQTATAGAIATFSAAASGTPAPTVQWLKNGATISGATNSTLTLLNVQAGDAASYAMVATNAAGSSTSNTATLTVNSAPAITTQPAGQIANPGTTVTFVGGASGSPAPSFQWRKSGTNIAGATNATLTLVNVQPADAASYSVVASNSVGAVASANATLSINIPPSFISQPVSQAAGVGSTITFAVNASGTPAPIFQWRRDGGNIAGATNPTLALSNIQLADAGGYSVVAINSAGSTVSGTATLTVTAGPGFASQPVSQTANPGATIEFSVATVGTPAPTLQWLKNGAIISGATSAMLTLTGVQLSDAATYSVVATNSAGTTTSDRATLTVNLPPTLTAQPAGQVLEIGAAVTLTVAATGTQPFSYQWFKDGAAIAGATGATLSLPAAQGGDVGSYTVRVSNALGAVTSAAAVLSGAPLNPGRIINLSILTTVSAAEPHFTVGTVIGGPGTSGTKPLLIRAAGPSLTPLGVGGVLADARLDVFSGSTVVATNNDWGGAASLAAAFAQVGAFAYASATSRDAAVFNDALAAGAYTVQVGGVDGATGVVIAELYDATPAAAFTAATPRLVNVSVLKQIDAGTTLTAGFVIGGATSKVVLIRVVGPTLVGFGVVGALTDPKVDLFAGPARIDGNDDWGGGATLTAAFAGVGAFALPAASRDAALVVTLAPGSYTAQVSGAGGAGGVALVEVYEVP